MSQSEFEHRWQIVAEVVRFVDRCGEEGLDQQKALNLLRETARKVMGGGTSEWPECAVRDLLERRAA